LSKRNGVLVPAAGTNILSQARRSTRFRNSKVTLFLGATTFYKAPHGERAKDLSSTLKREKTPAKSCRTPVSTTPRSDFVSPQVEQLPLPPQWSNTYYSIAHRSSSCPVGAPPRMKSLLFIRAENHLLSPRPAPLNNLLKQTSPRPPQWSNTYYSLAYRGKSACFSKHSLATAAGHHLLSPAYRSGRSYSTVPSPTAVKGLAPANIPSPTALGRHLSFPRPPQVEELAPANIPSPAAAGEG